MTTPGRGTVPRHGLWVAALFVVLAGLFGMHGLAQHGTGDMGDMTGHKAAPIAHVTVAPAVLATAATGALETVATAGGEGAHGMVGLCLAVLAGGLLLLLSLLARRRALGLLLRVDPRRPPLPGLDRDPDPPSLSQLSILRC